MSIRIAIALIMAATCSGFAYSEEEFVCGMSEVAPAEKILLAPGDTLRGRIIYVGFPNRMDLVTLNDFMVNTLPAEMGTFITRQSRGKCPADIQALRNPYEPMRAWMARHTDEGYALPESVSAFAQYGACYGTGPFTHAGELQAEIVHAIYDAYMSYDGTNPFANVDILFFVNFGRCLYDNTLDYPWYQGYGRLQLYADCADFLSTIGRDRWPYYYLVNGMTQNWYNPGNPWNIRFVLAHEFGHKIGLMHPHDIRVHSDEEQYYFGPYNCMRNEQLPAAGFVPYHPLDMIKVGWLPEPTEVTSNLRDLEIFDIRGDTGQLYRVATGGPDTDYLLLAYHAITGDDAMPDSTGAPLYKSRGVAVWHVKQNVKYDLESAWGRFADPISPGDPSLWDPSTCADGFALGWDVEAFDSGYDNHDVWPTRGKEDARRYRGSACDFFGPSSGVMEYSFRSNPNTFGQTGVSRRSPQDVANSIMIKVKEDRGSSLIIDVLLGPHEELLCPNGGEAYQERALIPITWTREYTTDQPRGIIDRLDILFSGDNGFSWSTIASGIDATLGQWDWTPDFGDATSTGLIKLVCHNLNTAHVGDDTSDSNFAILPPASTAMVFQDRSGETGLDYTGQPYASAPIDYDNDGLLDLMITIQDAPSQIHRMTRTNEDGVPEFVGTTSQAFAGCLPQAGLRCLAVADYDNDGYADIFAAMGQQSRLYRNLGNRTFEDRSSALPQNSLYDAWAGSWADYDNNGRLDLLLVGGVDVNGNGDLDPSDGTGNIVLLKNYGGLFVDVSDSVGFGWPNCVLSASAAWGDADGDGDLDLFIADTRDLSGGGVGSFQFWLNNGDKTLTLSNAGRFPDGHKVQGNTAARWADMDSDGDLDLVISQESVWMTPWIYYNNGQGIFNERPPTALATGTPTAGVRAYDHDLDGGIDVLLLPRRGEDYPFLFSNRIFEGQRYFIDESLTVQLSDSGLVRGAVLADFNEDGDLDLYLGRRRGNGPFYFRSVQELGPDAPLHHWVGLNLVARPGSTDIGAMVTFEAPGFIQTQVVDGGCGRGGQMPRTLTCGLGTVTGPVEATIRWPDGCTTSASLVTGMVNEVHQAATILPGSAEATRTVDLENGTIDWIFKWQTDWESWDEEITIYEELPPCDLAQTVLTRKTPGVTYSHSKVGSVWAHELTWLERPCIPMCEYDWSIKTACGYSDAAGILKVKVCPAQ